MFLFYRIYANMCWIPLSMAVIPWFLSLWAVGIGLVIEFAYLFIAFPFSFQKALLADITMNAVSAACCPLLFLIYLVFLFFIFLIYKIISFPAHIALSHFSKTDTDFFFVVIYVMFELAGFMVTVFINTHIEMYVLKRIFKVSENLRKRFWGLFMVNLITYIIAVVILFFIH